MSRERIDLDELARLEEERDFLLRSIEDLDRERAAGDVDEDDYEELRRGYVARAAAAIEAVERHEAAILERRGTTRSGPLRRIAWIGGCVAFAVVAGVLVARSSGTRVAGDSLTGSIDAPGSAMERCTALSREKPAEAIECYGEILEGAPDDVEALTQQGWAYARSGDFDAATERFDRVVELDGDYPDVWVFIASVRNSTGDPHGAREALDRLWSLNPAPVLVSTLNAMGLETEVALAVLDDGTRACWERTDEANLLINEAFGPDGTAEKQAEGARVLSEATACFEELVADHLDDAEFLVLRSYTLGLMSQLDERLAEMLFPTAIASSDRALEVRPGDPTALALSATWANWEGRWDDAEAALDAIGDRKVNVLLRDAIDVDLLRQRVAAGRAAD